MSMFESEEKDSANRKIGLVEVKALTSSLVSAKKCRSPFPVVRCGERADGELAIHSGAQQSLAHASVKHHARQPDLQFMQRQLFPVFT
jgi:hypothetical protein